MAKNHEYLKGNLNGNRFLHLVSLFHHFFSFLSPPLSLSLFVFHFPFVLWIVVRFMCAFDVIGQPIDLFEFELLFG